ncbi:FG-GAP repeat protein [Streptomyces mirabilis]|uniref:FG-GAP repeat protein n=1 Tax=Streptomyces mirabilis TaxID=68239 RepID=UPI0036AC3CD2
MGKRVAQGAETVVWGSRSGLSSGATRLPLKSPRAEMEFGWSLAADDFNGDGKPDLAVADLDTVYVYRGGFSKSGTTGKVTGHRPSRSVIEVFQPTGLVAGASGYPGGRDHPRRPRVSPYPWRRERPSRWFRSTDRTVTVCVRAAGRVGPISRGGDDGERGRLVGR